MNNEDSIKGVLELADYMASVAMVVGIDISEGDEQREMLNRELMEQASCKLESKLRELINETHRAGYEAGWDEADEAMSWNRSM